MKNSWPLLVLALCIAVAAGCAPKDPRNQVHKEVMVIKKDGVEQKKEVRDPLEQGVQDDSPIIHYQPEQ